MYCALLRSRVANNFGKNMVNIRTHKQGGYFFLYISELKN